MLAGDHGDTVLLEVERVQDVELAALGVDRQGFVLLPKRWIVERTFGWLGRCRRLAKDFEHLTRSHVGFVILAMIRLMSRRIARLKDAT